MLQGPWHSHTQQTGSHPVCAAAQGLLSMGRGQEEALQSTGMVQVQLPALCHAAMGCLSQVEAECTVRAAGELSPPWGPSSRHDSAALAWPLLSPPDTNLPSCGWFLDPVQHFVYLAGTGSLWNCSFLTWMGDEMMRMTTVLEGGI